MFIRTEDFKELANVLSTASSVSDVSSTSENIELKVSGKTLTAKISGSDYCVTSGMDINEECEFHATVNANTLFKLVQKTTTGTIEFDVDSNVLILKGNGTYKLPLIYDGESIMTIPDFTIDNVENTFDVGYNVLESINSYNSKEMAKASVIVNPIQKLFYVDEKGCVTFTTGACVNKFDLPSGTKMLMSQRIVSLLKLFRGATVKCSIGKNGEQTRFMFESDNVKLVCIQPVADIDSFPIDQIRGLADSNNYTHSVFIDKDDINNAINRLEIINGIVQPVKFTFGLNGELTISSQSGGQEELEFECTTDPVEYEFSADVTDIKYSIDKFSGEKISFMFGNGSSILIAQNNISFIVPEVVF